MRRSHRSLLAISGLLIIAATAGAAVGWLTHWQSPLDRALIWEDAQVSADLDYGGDSRLELPSSDPNVEFPRALSELPSPPTQLAVDPKTGDLWFVIFTYNGATNDLYHYDSGSATLEKRSIPASTGSEFFSSIAVDGRGHVISAEGSAVLDIDPAGPIRNLSLPGPANYAQQPGWEGTYVIDMALAADGKAYITRMNAAAITEVDLMSGGVKEIAVPTTLGQVYFIELADNALWMTNWGGTVDVPSQTAVLNLITGKTELTSLKAAALAADGKGQVYVSKSDLRGLARAGSSAASVESMELTGVVDDGVMELLAVDSTRGTLWMGGPGIAGIMSSESTGGPVEYYALPYLPETRRASVPIACVIQACRSPGPAITMVGGIAVAPDGDLFFSDMSFNRIGIIHPR